jgi:hypothetical protein
MSDYMTPPFGKIKVVPLSLSTSHLSQLKSKDLYILLHNQLFLAVKYCSKIQNLQ